MIGKTVWIVSVRNLNHDVVNERCEIMFDNLVEVVEVYSTREKAVAEQKRLIRQYIADVEEFDADPMDVNIEEFTVQ